MKNKKQFADAEAVWQRVWFDEQIKNGAILARKRMGVPPMGFVNELEVWEWLGANFPQVRDADSSFMLPYKEFAVMAMDRLPYKEHLSPQHINALLWKFFLYNDVAFEFDKLFSAFETFIIDKGKKVFYKENESENLSDGLYIHIPTTASIPAIIKYIQQEKNRIKWLQEHSPIKTTKSKSLKVRKNFYRDIWIEYMMPWPMDMFERIFNRKFSYKEEGVAMMLDLMGAGKYTSETIKKAYTRSKTLRKKLSK